MWRSLALLAAGSVGACGTTASAPPRTLSNEVPVAVGQMGMFELGVASFGPITPLTPASVTDLQRAVGSKVRIESRARRGDEFHAYLGAEHLFYVIPNDDGSIFNIHAVSPKVVILEHRDWIIGAPFSGADHLTTCECWGEHPMCYVRGDHVAVGFVVSCQNLETPLQRRALQGVPIQRAVWSPRPFGADADPASSSPGVVSPPPRSLRDIFGGDP